MKNHIHVKGHLSPSWQAWFEGVEIVDEVPENEKERSVSSDLPVEA
jgi:hypothetical protein